MLQKEILLFLFLFLLCVALVLLFQITRRADKIKNYIVIGAGPVGLWTAALLSLSGKHVVVFEKRSQYTRKQPIRLWPTLFAKICMYPILYTEKGKSLRRILYKLGMKPFPVQKLELLLKQWLVQEASDLVTFHQAEIKTWEDLKKFHLMQAENVEWLYACDGAHSAWRERYFYTEQGGIFQTVLDIEHTSMDASTFQNKIKKKLVADFRASIKKVIRLSSTRTHLLLQQELEPYEVQSKNVDIIKARKITYGCYWADEAVREKIILCGDSLCGVPFNRSLRNGLSCSLVATQWPTLIYRHYYTRLKIQENMISNLFNQSLCL